MNAQFNSIFRDKPGVVVIFMQQYQNSKESENVIILHVRVKGISGKFHFKLLILISKQIYLRLTWENKTRTNHGLLEIKHNGVWGTVCDDSVNVTQVSVLHSMIEFQSFFSIIFLRLL